MPMLIIDAFFSQGLPLTCTFFISNEVKLHPTSAARAEEMLANHDGSFLFPPATKERLAEIGPWEDTILTVSLMLQIYL
jgi:hypothetical protein